MNFRNKYHLLYLEYRFASLIYIVFIEFGYLLWFCRGKSFELLVMAQAVIQHPLSSHHPLCCYLQRVYLMMGYARLLNWTCYLLRGNHSLLCFLEFEAGRRLK